MSIYSMFSKMLPMVIAGIFSYCSAARAQEYRLDLTWGTGKFTYPNTPLTPNTAFLVTIHQLPSSAAAQEFLNKTRIRVQKNDGTVDFDRTLSEQIKESGLTDRPDTLIKLGPGRPAPVLRLHEFVRLNEGSSLTLTPFLGSKNGKPLVNVNDVKPLQVGKGDETPGQETAQQLSSMQAKLNEKDQQIRDQKEKFEQLETGLTKSIQDLNDKLTYQQQSLDALKSPSKKKGKIENEVPFQPYFKSNCEGCPDLEGDLIYDFKCRQLLRVHIVGGAPHYSIVRDLTDIPVKAQELVRLRVVGINRYLYTVNAKVEDSLFNNEAPPIFGQFFNGTSDFASSLITGAQDAQKNAFKLFAGSADAHKNPQTDFDSLKKLVIKFQKRYSRLREERINAYILCADADCCRFPPKEPFSEYADLLSEINFQIGEIEAQYLSTIPSGDEINKRINSFQKVLDDCAKAPAAAKSDDNTDAGKPDPCAGENQKSLSDSIAKLREMIPLRATIDKLKASLPSIDDLEKLYLFDKNVVRDQFYYRLPPVYPQGDKLHVSLKIDGRDSAIGAEMKFMPTSHDELNLDFSVQNKFLFSFSSGPFLAFGNELNRPSYGWQRVPSSGTVIGADASYRLVQTNNAPLPVGVGGYANLGVKITRSFGLGGTIGGGITFNQDILPAFLGGITASFGDRQRINFTFGVAGVQVKELKSSLYLGSVYQSEPTPLAYDRPMKFAFVAAVSYSIFTSTSRLNIFSSSHNPQ